MKITLIREERESGKEAVSTQETDMLMEKLKTENKTGYITELRSITGFVAGHSGITAARYSELMLRTGELVMDVGTMLDGKKAVKEKLIDQLGGISDALDWLYREIERAE